MSKLNGKLVKILVVDDEKNLRLLIKKVLEQDNFEIITAETAEQALEEIDKSYFEIIITDLKLPGFSGIELFQKIRDYGLDSDVIIITAFASASSAIEALKLGAADYLQKPFNIEELRIIVNRIIRQRKLVEENVALKRQLLADVDRAGLIGKSRALKNTLSLIQKVSKTDVTVLITGESGVGKELVAKAIHANSSRSDKRFLSINCAALPDTLLESELFGVEKGAFTGAVSQRKGLFELADGGTLFLDEIAEIPIHMQAKLLRVLQEFIIRRVGGTVDKKINVRLVAATNKDLNVEIQKMNFREDLFYRINVFQIHVPPLRDRIEDITFLFKHFIRKYALTNGIPVPEISNSVLELIEKYTWPGNVRELENLVERIMAFSPEGGITEDYIPDYLKTRDNITVKSKEIPETGFDIESYLKEVRQHYMDRALEKTGYNMTEAARLLGMSFRSFRYHYHKEN